MKPGVTVRPFSSMTFVAESANARIASFVPTVRILFPLMAIASPMELAVSTVMMRPLSRMVSAVVPGGYEVILATGTAVPPAPGTVVVNVPETSVSPTPFLHEVRIAAPRPAPESFKKSRRVKE
jgi:hypothetical protein